MTDRVSPAAIQLAVLALWIGAAGFFSVAVAPALFAVLPTRTLAGAVVGRLLPAIFYSGIVSGVLVALIQVATQDAWSWSGRGVAGLLMIAGCAVGQLIVGPRITRLRAEIGSDLEHLPVDDVRRIAFGRLHGMSVAWLGLAMLAAVAAAVIAVRALESRR